MTNPLRDGEERGPSCLSDLVLDRIRVAEVDASTHGAHLRDCTRCSARLEALIADDRAFQHDAEARISRLVVRTRKPSTRRVAVTSVGFAFALAAAVMLWFRPSPDPGAALPAVDGPTKGALALTLVVRDSSGNVRNVVPDDALHPGEAVRFVVKSPVAGHLVVVGADASGAVTRYAPSTGPAVQVRANAEHVMEGSIILDDVLGAERFIAVVCSRPVDPADVLTAAKRSLQVGSDVRNGCGH